jgi:hypothetical protein
MPFPLKTWSYAGVTGNREGVLQCNLPTVWLVTKINILKILNKATIFDMRDIFA